MQQNLNLIIVKSSEKVYSSIFVIQLTYYVLLIQKNIYISCVDITVLIQTEGLKKMVKGKNALLSELALNIISATRTCNLDFQPSEYATFTKNVSTWKLNYQVSKIKVFLTNLTSTSVAYSWYKCCFSFIVSCLNEFVQVRLTQSVLNFFVFATSTDFEDNDGSDDQKHEVGEDNLERGNVYEPHDSYVHADDESNEGESKDYKFCQENHGLDHDVHGDEDDGEEDGESDECDEGNKIHEDDIDVVSEEHKVCKEGYDLDDDDYGKGNECAEDDGEGDAVVIG